MQDLKQLTLLGESDDSKARSRLCFRPSFDLGVDDDVSVRKSPDDIVGANG